MSRLLFFLCTMLCPVWGSLVEQGVEVLVHSAESFYECPASKACFTLRIHVRAPQGSFLAEPTASPVERSPLIGVDAAGRPLIGILRSVESCMERCRILVYDFYARPQGGWIEFDSSVLLPMSHSSYDLVTEPFDPHLPGTIRVWGNVLFRTPLPLNEEKDNSKAVVFRQEYELVPLLRSVSFCNEDGSQCQSSVLNADFDESSGMTSSTYLLHPTGNLVRLVLHCMHPAIPCPVHMRFRIYAGGVTQP